MSGKSRTSGWAKWTAVGDNKHKRRKPSSSGARWRKRKLPEHLPERAPMPARRVRGKTRATDVATPSPPAAPCKKGSQLKVELKAASCKYVPPPGALTIPPSWLATEPDSDDDPAWELRPEQPPPDGCAKCPFDRQSLAGLLQATNARFKGAFQESLKS